MGRPHTEEAKRKMAEAARRRWANPEIRAVMVEAVTRNARCVTDETRKKRSDNGKRLWADPEYRAKSVSVRTGKKLGPCKPTTKNKLSTSRRTTWRTPGYRERNLPKVMIALESARGPVSDQTRRVLSHQAKAQWSNPETRARMSAAIKIGVRREANNPETSGRRSRVQKRLWESRQHAEKVLGARVSAKRTSLERALASILDEMGLVYQEQLVIGRCIADFYVPNYNAVLEADGHFWHNLPGAKQRDGRRDAWLRRQGYRVLRLPEHLILTDPRPQITEFL